MPLWTSPIRTLSHNRHLLSSANLAPRHTARWSSPIALRASSNTASPASQRDEQTQRSRSPLPPLHDLLATGPNQTAPWQRIPTVIRGGAAVSAQDDHPPHTDAAACTSIAQVSSPNTIAGYELDRHNRSSWEENYLKMKSFFSFDAEQKSASPCGLPTLHPRTSEWVETVLEELRRGNVRMSAAYLKNLTGDATYGWLQIALWLLTYDPSMVLHFLLATHDSANIGPTWAVVICLTDIAARLSHSTDASQSKQMQEVAEALIKLADRHDGRYLRIKDPFVTALLPHCSADSVRRLYEAIRQGKVRVRYWTYLHLVDACAKHDLYHEALGALIGAKEHPVNHAVGDVNSWPFRFACSTLLRRCITQPDGLRETLRIVSTIVELGVQLDRPLCDIIMLNAIEAGDLKTAFDVYHSLMQRGLQPNEDTYTVLLKGCKSNIDDVQMLDEVIRDAISNMDVRKSKIVADNILHCLAMHHSKHHPKSAFKTLFEAYAQFYDVAPLKRLGLQLPMIARGPLTTDAPMPANRHALFFVISAAINHMLLQDPNNPKVVLPLYDHWRKLVASGDPELAELASTPDMSTQFLCAFARSQSSLMLAARVIKDMQTALPESAGVTQALPSVRTWNAFLHGFMRHGERDLAEQVATYMRKKGIKETVVTWNTLLHGYARANDAVKGLDVLRAGRKQEAQWDEWTESTLYKYKGNEGKKVWKAYLDWADRVGMRQLDFTEDVKDELVQRVQAERMGRENAGNGVDNAGVIAATPADLSHSDNAGEHRPI